MENNGLQLSYLLLFAQSLGIGFLIGLERQRNNDSVAGLRTFSLIALTGALAGYTDSHNQHYWFTLAMMVAVVGSLLVAQLKSTAKESDTTTVMAGLLTFGLSNLLWLTEPILPATLAVIVTAILYFRDELRKAPKKLTSTDINSFFQFAAVVFILLPVLPNETYGPYQIFNPYKTGWLVVLISGLSLAGYVILRLRGGKAGFLVVGLLGGMASTTATTMIYAKHSKQIDEFSNIAATIILLSHLMLFIRVAIVVSFVEHSMLLPMLPWLTGGLLFGGAYSFWLSLKLNAEHQQLPALNLTNPAELKTAFGFSLAFVVVLLLAAWMNDVFADTGVYAVAFISGLTDLDAITISNLNLVTSESITQSVAVVAIVVAFFANLLFKFGLVFFIADKSLRRPIIQGFAILSAGCLLGLSASNGF